MISAPVSILVSEARRVHVSNLIGSVDSKAYFHLLSVGKVNTVETDVIRLVTRNLRRAVRDVNWDTDILVRVPYIIMGRSVEYKYVRYSEHNKKKHATPAAQHDSVQPTASRCPVGIVKYTEHSNIIKKTCNTNSAAQQRAANSLYQLAPIGTMFLSTPLGEIVINTNRRKPKIYRVYSNEDIQVPKFGPKTA